MSFKFENQKPAIEKKYRDMNVDDDKFLSQPHAEYKFIQIHRLFKLPYIVIKPRGFGSKFS